MATTSPYRMLARLTASALATGLALTFVAPALAADSPSLGSVQLCEGTGDRVHARCITDAIKTLKEIEHDYSEWEDDEIAAWKAAHRDMGIGPDYQSALRAFLTEMRTKRTAFRKDVQEFRKAFFAEQKAKRKENTATQEPTAPAVPAITASRRKAAEAICGEEDDDGAFRICMRVQLRRNTQDVSKRSRTNTRVIQQQ